jgi:geranylgeranyl diphosphate synthase, type II
MNAMAVRQSVPFAIDRAEINRYLERLLDRQGGEGGGIVLDAMAYAVLGSAQRIRPILSLQISRFLGAPPDATFAAAAAVELLHCASLILDDLPCMDNSPVRRGRPAVHVKFGESIAILAALALVALAARSVAEAPCAPGHCRCLLDFQLSLLKTLDCSGLIAGQALDLANAGNAGRGPSTDIADLKTVPLFLLAVQAGSLIPVQDANSRALLVGFGREFGLAFQMSDDLLDGEEKNSQPFLEKLSLLRSLVGRFGSGAVGMESLIDYLNDRTVDNEIC